MEYEKAKQITKDFIKAIEAITQEANHSKTNAVTIQKCLEKNKNLQNQIQEFKEYKRKFQLLQTHSVIEICQQCNGFGGGTDGDEYSGFIEWFCDTCEGKGVELKKSIHPTP